MTEEQQNLLQNLYMQQQLTESNLNTIRQQLELTQVLLNQYQNGLAVLKELELQTGEQVDMGKWNPYGGAISYGHPNGASGSRICIFALKHLIRTGGKYGLISSCCGGGLGVVTILENLRR